MDIDELISVCAKYVDANFAAAKMKKKNVDVLYIRLIDPEVFGTTRCAVAKKIDGVRYYLRISPFMSLLQIGVGEKSYTLPDVYNMNTLRIFHLKRRISTVLNTMHKTENTFEKIAHVNVMIKRRLSESHCDSRQCRVAEN